MSDVKITNIYIEGNEVDKVPEQNTGYLAQNAECSNGVSAEWNNTSWALNIGNFKKATECKIYFVKEENYDEAKVNPSSGGSGTIDSNPATGAFINVFFIGAIDLLATVIIMKARKNSKFYRV